MGFFDRFRKTKTEEAAKDEDGGIEPLPELEEALPEEEAPVKKKHGPHDWAILLAINTFILVGSVGLLGARIIHHFTAPEVVTVAKPVPKPKPVPKKAAEAPKKEEPKKEAAKKDPPQKAPPKKAAPIKPLPKPSLAAAAAPTRKTPAPQSESAEVKPSKSEKKRVTAAVSFKHDDPTAKEVALMGMFLVRSQGRKRMFKDSKGVWRSTVYLKTGQTYDYKFEIIDSKSRKRTTSIRRVTVP